MKIQIYVAGHKEFASPYDDVYVPIIGGMENHKHNPSLKHFLGDNTGDNISVLNPNFCELTVHYWIWKNDTQSDVVGLNHYRRLYEKKHFGNNLFYKYINDEKIIIEGQEIAAGQDFDFSNLDIIVPGRWRLDSALKQYRDAHHIEDMFLIREQVKKYQSDYIDAFDFFIEHCNYFHHTNMIIARKDIFNEYSSWLFSLLFPLIDKKFYSNYKDGQERVFGFLSERLLSVWLLKNRENLRIDERPWKAIDAYF